MNQPQLPLGTFFELLNKLSESELAQRLGVTEAVRRVIYQTVKTGTQAGATASSRFRQIRRLLPEQRLKAAPRPRLFDLTPTEEQEMTRDMLRAFAAEQIRPLAHGADRSYGAPAAFFAEVAELGLTDVAIPEALGGAGEVRSPISNALIAEAMAHGDMGVALAALAPLGFINAVTDFGSEGQQGRYLPPFCEGAYVPAALALSESRAGFDPARLDTWARREADGYELNGAKHLVPVAGRAEVFLVFAHLEGIGPRGFFVEAKAPGLTVSAERTMGLRSAELGRLELRGVKVRPDALLAEHEVPYEHERLVDSCRIGLAALGTGTCQAVLDYVIEYVNGRIAFGEPISHRQAVAFTVADMATELEAMRLMVWRAASRAEQGLSYHEQAWLTRLFCAEKAMQIGSSGVQLLGGHGYVCDHPVERWYRDLRALAVFEGGLAV